MVDMLTASREHGPFDGPDTWPSEPHVRSRAKKRRLDLLPAVDRAVIPRLHAALRKDLQRPRHPLISDENARREEILDLAERMLAGDHEGACHRIDAVRRAGRSLESIFLKLLAPTACHLRDLWSDDLCGFAEVTFALCNLQSLLRHYALDFYAEATSAPTGSRVLVVAPKGNGVDVGMSMFGLVLMSHFYRREGWDAWIEQDLAGEKFRQAVGEWFDLVEVLAASDVQLDEVSSGIRAIRRNSPNTSIGVIVCGQIFSERPDYLGLVGADLMASDPLTSLSQAKSFVTAQTQRRRLS